MPSREGNAGEPWKTTVGVIGHVTVKDGSEADGDLVLYKPSCFIM